MGCGCLAAVGASDSHCCGSGFGLAAQCTSCPNSFRQHLTALEIVFEDGDPDPCEFCPAGQFVQLETPTECELCPAGTIIDARESQGASHCVFVRGVPAGSLCPCVHACVGGSDGVSNVPDGRPGERLVPHGVPGV